jgi:hypothetical protein
VLIEIEYSSVAQVKSAFSWDRLDEGWVRDALIHNERDLARLSRARQERAAQAAIEQSTHRSQDLLRRAAVQMSDVDLDSAWRAALRGDSDVLHARLLPHVDTRTRKQPHRGSPWRRASCLPTGTPKPAGARRQSKAGR